MQGALLNRIPDNIEKQAINFNHEIIPYKMSLSDGIEVSKDKISVTGSEALINLDANHSGKGEYYVSVKGLYSNKITAYIRVHYNDIEKMFVFKGTDNQHYTDRHDYIVNLGFLDGIYGKVSIDFSDGGDYSYESIDLVYQPLENQIRYVEERRDLDINSLAFDTNKVIADVTVNENKALCFSIPYSQGWKAYLDGNEAELLNCNIQYMAIILPKGNHRIELKYSTPLMKEGGMLSFLGLVLLSFSIMKQRSSMDKADIIEKNL